MVSATRSFAAETLRDGTANLNEPIYTLDLFGGFTRGSFTGAADRSIVDGVMAARCGIATFETDPGGPPFISNVFASWYYDANPLRFITEARATFQVNTSASNYLQNATLWIINGTVGEDYFDLRVSRLAIADPWTVVVNGVDSGVTIPQNTDEADVTLYFTSSTLRYVVTVATVDILDETILATGYPQELTINTAGTLTRDFSPGGGSPATGEAYGSVNDIAYTLTPYIITTTLPDGYEGGEYLAELQTDGDPGTYSVVEGSLPPGLNIDPDTGEITGTPTDPDVYSFTIGYTETDTGAPHAREYSLTIVGADPEAPPPAWTSSLNGSTICGGECADLQVDACLKVPPVGLGVPALRVEDQTYPQRDGVEHFSDWYEPRIITMEATIGGSSAGCGCNSDAHAAARRVASAWSRQCDDVELVIRPDICTDVEDRELSGPFGIIGRPRVAEINWRRGKSQIADALLRFDAVDHRIYILDADGTPGSGAECATVDAPGNIVYWSAVGTTLAYHHWPLDFPNIGSQESSGVVIGAANDVIGSFDSAPVYSVQGPGILGYPVQVPPISYGLSMSAVQGPAAFQGRPWSVAYSSGMVGWWQETPVGAIVSGAGVLLDGSSDYRVGLDVLSRPAPVVKFGGAEVALNADAQAALGFTDDYHGQPVLVMFTWISGTLCIFAAHDGTSSPFLVQTVAGTGQPADGGAFQVLMFSGKVSNIMQTMDLFPDPEADGEDVMEQLAPYGFDTPLSELVLSDVGQLCVPIQVTFEQGPTYSDVYIFKNDGSYVGLTADPSVYQPTTLNTETGSATRYYGTMDATNDILGNPFLTVMPGETLNVFGGGEVTICYRPAVIST